MPASQNEWEYSTVQHKCKYPKVGFVCCFSLEYIFGPVDWWIIIRWMYKNTNHWIRCYTNSDKLNSSSNIRLILYKSSTYFHIILKGSWNCVLLSLSGINSKDVTTLKIEEIERGRKRKWLREVDFLRTGCLVTPGFQN